MKTTNKTKNTLIFALLLPVFILSAVTYSPVEIMPLGDSITYGTPEQSGYRKTLYNNLIANGYNVDFTGGLTTPFDTSADFDNEHEGHRGWKSSDIAANVFDFLTASPADVVLLHIGTNGLTQNVDAVNTILNEIDRYNTNIVVIVAKIINQVPTDPLVDQFNYNLYNLVQNRINNGDLLYWVNIHDELTYTLTEDSGDMADQLHPNESGYQKMAAKWYEALTFAGRNLIPISDTIPPRFETVAPNTAISGKLMTYNAKASAYPAPTYSLISEPSGMTVDSVTGTVEWAPGLSSTYTSTLRATSGTDYEDQLLSIKVLDLPENILAYWQFDDTSTTVKKDSVDGHDSLLAGGYAPANIVSGLIGDALDFSSASGYNTPDHSDFDWSLSDDITLEMWIKNTSIPSANAVIIGRDDPSTYLHWWVGISGTSATPAFVLRDKSGTLGSVSGTTPLSDGNWHHITAIRDATVNELRIYVDGVEEGRSTVTYTDSFDSTASINTGRLNLGSGFPYYGLLDETAIYNRALPVDEITLHYQSGLNGFGFGEPQLTAPSIVSTPVTYIMYNSLYTYQASAVSYPDSSWSLIEGPSSMDINSITGEVTWTVGTTDSVDVTILASNSEGSDTQSFTITVLQMPAETVAYWQFNETGGTVFRDALGINNAYKSSSKTVPSPTPGLIGNAQNFNGTTTGAETASPTDFDWLNEESFSIETWIKSSGSTGNTQIIAGREDTSGNLHWWVGLSFTAGNKPAFYLQDTDANTFSIVGTTNVTDGAWHHITVVYNGDFGELRLYVDGSPEGTLAASYTGDFTASNAPLTIGWLNTGGGFHFNGKIDETAVYRKSLTDNEISLHYTNGLNGFGYGEKPESPPSITSTPPVEARVDGTYSHQLIAAGYPEPTFSLVSGPVGMTVSTAGLIQWSPSSNGLFSVELAATNTAGTGLYNYDLEVFTYPTDLIAYWKLDQTEGINIKDSAGDHDGTVANGKITPPLGNRYCRKCTSIQHHYRR